MQWNLSWITVDKHISTFTILLGDEPVFTCNVSNLPSDSLGDFELFLSDFECGTPCITTLNNICLFANANGDTFAITDGIDKDPENQHFWGFQIPMNEAVRKQFKKVFSDYYQYLLTQ